jgi:CubicO group peptidase (beta-lactamase class C family)
MTAQHVESIPISFLRGQYFGLGVAVQKATGESGLLSSPGTYGWSGAYNTYFRIDPKEQLVLIIMVERVPGNDLDIQYGFHNAVMQAIVD